MSNPFNYSSLGSLEKMVGRQDIVKTIVDNLVNPTGPSHAIIGGRRFGKTSLLWSLEHTLLNQIDTMKQEGLYIFPVLVDLNELGNNQKHSPEFVFGRMVKKLYEAFDTVCISLKWRTEALSKGNITSNLQIEAITGSSSSNITIVYNSSFAKELLLIFEKTELYTFGYTRKNACTLDEFASIMKDLINAFLHNYKFIRIVFLLDEIEVCMNENWMGGLFSQLRSAISNINLLGKYTRYVIGGSSKFFNATKVPGSPLFNVLKSVPLEILDKKNIIEIVNWANNVPIGVADLVARQSGGHPYIAQYLMHHLWEACKGNLSGSTIELVYSLSNKFFVDQISDVEHWLEDVGETGICVYKLLAEAEDWLTVHSLIKHLPSTSLPLERGLAALCYHGLITHDGTWSRYRITGELFRDWFKNNQPPPSPDTGAPQSSPINILYLCADKDQRKGRDFFEYAKLLHQPGSVSAWDRSRMGGGEDIPSTIKKHLQLAHIIVLFVTDDLILPDTADYQFMKQAMDRHNDGKARVLPVILDTRVISALSKSPLKGLSYLPKTHKSLSTRNIFAEVLQELTTLVETLRKPT